MTSALSQNRQRPRGWGPTLAIASGGVASAFRGRNPGFRNRRLSRSRTDARYCGSEAAGSRRAHCRHGTRRPAGRPDDRGPWHSARPGLPARVIPCSPNRWPDNSRQEGESGRPAPCPPARTSVECNRHALTALWANDGVAVCCWQRALSGRLRHQRYGNEQRLRTLRSSERSRSAFALSTGCRQCAASRPGRFMQVQVPTLERPRCG